ncbi:hypothetical protein RN001_004794 [Aquatica leii]|uniref:Carboxylesterase type B domain-containing protein n=1 Tax=Aquatica leii TaxID=1421715 RepID=A0AAN7SRV9_9COLE|nr:hypothetical protein RN001_004794 [Aquatica leii]
MVFKSIIRILIFYAITEFVLATNKNRFKYPLKNGRPIVELTSGLVVVGTVNKTSGARITFHAYRGIPFAKPPIGDLRFKAPVALPKNLTGHSIDASQDKSQCVQLGVPVTGSEDCLYINVYVPMIENTSKLPVMVWIYGGAFISGNSSYSLYGPDYFLNENVLFVSFNYRLGAFGFLSTENEVSPGNYGLKDQILALQWVQENIEKFGGNNSRVTIFSESAGAASASYLSQTPLTDGLFQNAIFESGNSITLWALARNAKSVAFKIGKFLHLNTTTSQSLIDDLRKVDYRNLAVAQTLGSVNEALTGNLLNGLPFGPIIEPPHIGAVVTNYSYEQLKNGLFHRIPYLMGINSQEGKPFEHDINAIRSYLLQYDLFPTELVPASLNISDINTKILINFIIKYYYFEYTPVTVSQQQLTEFISDDQFNRPIIEAALLYSKYSPVYFYKFAYEGPLGSNHIEVPGVGHADELNYLFKKEQYPGKPIAFDLLTRRRLVRLWTNFAKTGNPTPSRDPLLQNVTWSLSNADKSCNLRYLNINRSLTNMDNPKWTSFKFWKKLFKDYGNPPYSTY